MAVLLGIPMQLVQEIKAESIGTIKVPMNKVSTFKASLLVKQSPVELTITKSDVAEHALMSIDLKVFGVTFVEVYKQEDGSQLIRMFIE